jgi:outer membrane biosynthesis protein TonB
MTQSTSGNGAGATRSSTLTFCTWEIPDKGVKINLHLSTVEWVDFEMKKALRFQTQGAKVSGLLLGRNEPGASRNIVIEGFTSLPREQEPALSYRFSASDKPILKVQIDQWQPGLGKNLYAVGYYRSDFSGKFTPDEQDAAVGKEYFPGSTSVFLLVKPSLTETSKGALFLCENGEVKPDSKILFPFNRASLAGDEPSSFWEEKSLLAEASYPDHSWSDPFDSQPRPSLLLEKSSLAQWFRWPLMVALGLIIVVIAGTAYHILRKPEGQAAREVAYNTDSLALKVEIERNQIRIGWDRNSPVIAVAKRGYVSIEDGINTKSMDLDAHLLRTGSLVYSTFAADVTVRLQIEAADRIASESVRAVRSGRPGRTFSPSAAPAGDAPASRSGASTEIRSPGELSLAIADSSDIGREGARPRTPSRAGTEGADLSGSTVRSRGERSLPRAGKERMESASEEARSRVLARAGTEQGRYVAPRPINRVEPEPSFTLHPFIVPEVQINVRVVIDRSGRVTRAESLSRGNALMEHLSKIAVQAARQWTFSPARHDGQNVSSETMLQFQFVNKSLRKANTTE